MKRTKIKAFLFAAAIALAVLPGCKKFLDVNDNPNAATDAEPPLILSSLQGALAHVVSYQYQTYGNFWSQYWTQLPNSSQFRSLETYSSSPSDFDRPWGILYADALQDADSLIAKGGPAKYKQYAAIAWILRAYAFHLLTDGFGDIPLKDALMGKENRSPHYDPQQEVYDSIFVFIDRGISLIDEDSDFHPGADDMLLGGNMANWRLFANTLKLRAYMRLSEVDNAKAKAGIEALYTAGAKFITADVDMKWSAQGGNQNPLWAEVVALNFRNQGASSSVMDRLKSNNDPRLSSFYSPYRTTGLFRSIPQGYFDDTASTTPVSNPASIVLGALAPGRLMSASESYFLQAEAAVRGWNTKDDAATLYKQGIRANFTTYGKAAQADAYIDGAPAAQFPAAGTMQQKIETIITQKWFAMCGNQGFEAWCELRRTGYPSFLKKSHASILGNDNMPARMIYPQAELTRNSNFPGLKKIDEKMWWDK